LKTAQTHPHYSGSCSRVVVSEMTAPQIRAVFLGHF